MKPVQSLICSILLICSFAWPAAAQAQSVEMNKPIAMFIDDMKLSATPLLNQGTVYIPIRTALEYMGARVSFQGRQIVVTRGDTVISMELGKTTVLINGDEIAGTAAPILQQGSTYLPIRFFGNALGYDVVYQPSARRVVLHAPGANGVIYGYAEDLDGAAIQRGTITLENTDTGQSLETPIRNGFYRISVEPHQYRFTSYEDYAQEKKQKVDIQDSFQVSAGQTAYYTLRPAQTGHRVTLNDPEGHPIHRAEATFYTSHGAVSVPVRNGIGYLDFNEPGTYNFNYLTVEDSAKQDYDSYYPFTIDEDGTVSALNIIAHPPNIIGKAAGEANSVYGNLDISDKTGPESNFVQGAPGGAFSFYLPDGSYAWESYYDSSIRQHFKVGISFNVKNGQPDVKLQWEKPVINVHGTASTNEKGPLSGGYIYFRTNGGEEYSAWVQNGEFSCHLPDGTYNVSYEQFVDDHFTVSLNTSLSVANDKLTSSPTIMFYLS